MNKTQKKNYQKRMQELSALHESTLLMGAEAQQQHRVRTYWKMGRRMADVFSGPRRERLLNLEMVESGLARYVAISG